MNKKHITKSVFSFGMALSMLTACSTNTEQIATTTTGVIVATTTPAITEITTTERSTEIMENSEYQYRYNPDVDGVELVKYIGSGGDIVIPEEIDDTAVKIIGDNAFYKNDRIKSITISDSIIEIGKAAFSGCDYPEIISLGNGVEIIGDNAFYMCKSTETLVIPDSVTYIGKEAFYYCKCFNGVSFGTNIKEIGESAFNSALVSETNTEISISGSIETIGKSAFAWNEKLSRVIIEDGLENIGNTCFEYCTGLDYVELPSSLTNIGSSLFSSTTNNHNEFTVKYNGTEYMIKDYNDLKALYVEFGTV